MTIDDRLYKLASVHPVFKKDFEKFIDLHGTAGDQERTFFLFIGVFG